MYLILRSRKGEPCSHPKYFEAMYTDDVHEAYEWLQKGAMVYLLDRLTQIIDIDITYQEKTKEQSHD